MAGEPELHPHQSSEWVTYLQQLLRHHGLWSGEEDGTFGDELLAVVRHLQETYQMHPADGIVRSNFWALLTGESTTAGDSHNGDQAHGTQHGGQTHGGQGHGGQAHGDQHGAQHGDQHGAQHGAGAAMHATGAHPQETPASMVAGGLPSFKYNLPNIPLSEVTFDSGAALVHVQLTMIGSVTVTFEHAAAGITTTVNDQSWRIAAQESLHGLTEGIQIQGIGGKQISISSTFGNQFEQVEVRYTPPNTMSFIGTCHIAYHIDTHIGTGTVKGSVGYQLDVTVTPHVTREPEVQDEHSWFEEHSKELLVGGAMVLLVVAAVALAPETGGGSLILLAVP